MTYESTNHISKIRIKPQIPGILKKQISGNITLIIWSDIHCLGQESEL